MSTLDKLVPNSPLDEKQQESLTSSVSEEKLRTKESVTVSPFPSTWRRVSECVEEVLHCVLRRQV